MRQRNISFIIQAAPQKRLGDGSIAINQTKIWVRFVGNNRDKGFLVLIAGDSYAVHVRERLLLGLPLKFSVHLPVLAQIQRPHATVGYPRLEN